MIRVRYTQSVLQMKTLQDARQSSKMVSKRLHFIASRAATGNQLTNYIAQKTLGCARKGFELRLKNCKRKLRQTTRRRQNPLATTAQTQNPLLLNLRRRHQRSEAFLRTTTDDGRRTTYDRRRTTDDGRRTTHDARRTTHHGRRDFRKHTRGVSKCSPHDSIIRC